jgi:hypothetical protein
MLLIDVLANSRDITAVRIPREIADALISLPEGSDSYFARTPTCQLVSVAELVASRVRPEGVVSANKLMALAARNMIEKRQPLKVRRFGSKFLVVDGNSTFVNAKFSGWNWILCEVAS